MNAKLLFIGTGGSMGSPVIGCQCGVCRSASPFDKRLRPSALIKVDNKNILIDAGPDLRTQALTHKINTLDGLILTHAHHDHIAGVDDLRAYLHNNQKPIELVLSGPTWEELRSRFFYFFTPERLSHSLIPEFNIKILPKDRGMIDFLALPLKYFTFIQAGMEVNGIRLGNMAYVSDIYNYPESIFEDLEGIEILIISALRFTPSKMHLSVDEALAFSRKVKAKKTWFTHISHDLDHQRTNAYLPEDVRLAYDGLEIDFQIND